MPSENDSEIRYELFEDKKAIKFMDKHFADEKLINRIYDKYYLNCARIPRLLQVEDELHKIGL